MKQFSPLLALLVAAGAVQAQPSREAEPVEVPPPPSLRDANQPPDAVPVEPLPPAPPRVTEEAAPDAPPPAAIGDGPKLPPPTVTIERKDGKLIETYSRGGVVYMVRVTPKYGPPYYLVDMDGDGVVDQTSFSLVPNLLIPQWVLYEWD